MSAFEGNLTLHINEWQKGSNDDWYAVTVKDGGKRTTKGATIPPRHIHEALRALAKCNEEWEKEGVLPIPSKEEVTSREPNRGLHQR